jgi:hypothetical protein
MDMGSDMDMDKDMDVDVGMDVGMDMDTELDMEMDTELDMEMDTDLDMEMDTDLDMEMDTDLDMEMDTDLDMEMDTDLDMEMDTHSDVIFCFGSNRNKPKLDLFRSFSRNCHVIDKDMDMVIFFGFFRMVFGCFGYIETPKQAVLILKQNNRNKHLVSDSAETSFG